MPRQDEPTKHVALVGMTGVGKSTLVNMLSGLDDRAEVNNDVTPCTTKPTRYDVEVSEGRRYSLWDTRGLNEALEQEAMGSLVRFFKFLRIVPDADKQLRNFLRGKNPRIDLILFCIEANKIQVPAQWKNYDKIYVKFCKRKINVAVVVTRMDSDTRRRLDWRKICEDMVMGAVGEYPDARLIEAVPKFRSLEETVDCKREILRLMESNFS